MRSTLFMVLAFVLAFIYALSVGFEAFNDAVARRDAERILQTYEPKEFHHNIEHCLTPVEKQELWDCVRNINREGE